MFQVQMVIETWIDLCILKGQVSRFEAVKNHRQKNFFTCSFKEKLKKWETIKIFRSVLSKFQRIW